LTDVQQKKLEWRNGSARENNNDLVQSILKQASGGNPFYHFRNGPNGLAAINTKFRNEMKNVTTLDLKQILRLLLIPLLGWIVFMLTRNAIVENTHRILDYVGASTALVMAVLAFLDVEFTHRVTEAFHELGKDIDYGA
jgi:hypothetical protein